MLSFARTGKNWAPRCQVKKKKRKRRKSRKKVSSLQGDRVHSLLLFQLEFSCFLFSCTQAAVCSSKSSVCQCLSTVPDIHWISVLRLTVSRLCWLWFCLCVGATLPVVPILKKIFVLWKRQQTSFCAEALFPLFTVSLSKVARARLGKNFNLVFSLCRCCCWCFCRWRRKKKRQKTFPLSLMWLATVYRWCACTGLYRMNRFSTVSLSLSVDALCLSPN